MPLPPRKKNPARKGRGTEALFSLCRKVRAEAGNAPERGRSFGEGTCFLRNIEIESGKFSLGNSSLARTARTGPLLNPEYGAVPGTVNEEVRALAGIRPEEVITCRPADRLEPELEKYKEEFKDVARSEEDVLSLALFPQVAAKFLAVRDAEKTPEAPQQADPNAVRELYVEFNG